MAQLHHRPRACFSVAVAGGAVGVRTGRAPKILSRGSFGFGLRRCQHDRVERKNWLEFAWALLIRLCLVPTFRTPYLSPSSALVACPLLYLLPAAPSYQYATIRINFISINGHSPWHGHLNSCHSGTVGVLVVITPLADTL